MGQNRGSEHERNSGGQPPSFPPLKRRPGAQFITFRSSTPLVISICDFIFLGRELPNGRSWACLLGLLCGAVGYVMTDAGFRVEAY